MNVPFLDLQAQYQKYKSEFDAGIQAVLDSSAYIQGPAVEEFERRFADYLGVKHVLGVANGTDALYLSLRACEIGPGDEVITAANTFLATTEAISATGATIVLVDADPNSYTLDPTKLPAAITEKTKAIIPVHLYGQPADMDAILPIAREHKLRVIEDACQAHGAHYGEQRAGTLGDMGCFSCYPGKNLGAFGDAGIVVTNDNTLAERIRLLANHGSRKKYVHEVEGWNSRLDTIQAAVLNVKLQFLDEWNESRMRHAARYEVLLEGVPVITPSIVRDSHVWHLYVIQTESRDALASHLSEHGIATGIHYPLPIHLLPAYEHLNYERGCFPVSERTAERIVSLPMFPELTEDQISYVAETIRSFFSDAGHRSEA